MVFNHAGMKPLVNLLFIQTKGLYICCFINSSSKSRHRIPNVIEDTVQSNPRWRATKKFAYLPPRAT